MLRMLNPPSAQIGMVAFPPLSRLEHRPCATARHGHGQRDYTGYDAADPRLPDRSDRRHLQARERHARTQPPGSTCTPCLVTRPRASRSAAYTSYSEALRQAQGGARRPRARERSRLHRLPDRRRGQHRQRLRLRPRDVSAGQRRRPAALPDGDQRRQRHKAAGMTIYSIGYALGTSTKCTGGKWKAIPATSRTSGARSYTRCTATPRHDGLRPLRDGRHREPHDHFDDTDSRRSHRPATSTTSRTPAT